MPNQMVITKFTLLTVSIYPQTENTWANFQIANLLFQKPKKRIPNQMAAKLVAMHVIQANILWAFDFKNGLSLEAGSD
jgi:hypothetical protein